ncbi:MAG TPA: ferritin-like domain-containing protein [Terriglobales bacterium]|nr:ferritin-like domain-containing protein [Terriglobales bacterium]
MKNETSLIAASETLDSAPTNGLQRRSFLKGVGAAGAALAGGSLLSTLGEGEAFAQSKGLAVGDVAILRFLAAAEIIETDLWQQYNELAGIPDDEVPGGSVIPRYQRAVTKLDSDMAQYIHDNTEDEMTHEVFINAYLASKGAETVSLDQFRTLPSSQATGAQQIGRLTNLMQLTVDTTWYTRYRSRTQNPDFGDTLPQAIASLATGQHPAIPRTDDDLNDKNFLQAIANTAGFHFATIEQGGSSLYPQLAQRVTSLEVLRILLSIGGTEIMHFQTWSDKAGNAPPLTAVDPVTGLTVTFPDLNQPPFGGEDFQTNLIMPEPTVFLSKKLPPCSIIRPTATKGAAMGALNALTADGLFVGQSKDFFQFMTTLAKEADLAVRQ